MYAKAFFDLQLQFAETVAALSGMPRPRVLLEYTNLYIRFGLGREFDPAHPGWTEYLAGLREATDGREWTYRFYSRRPDGLAAPALVATFGCFSYSRPGPDRIRLHFQNADPPGLSPLGAERQGQRLADLAALFAHVKRTERATLRVVGASWLYNLDAYRRLFPTRYLATARILRDRFRHMPLWGQFVDRDRELKPDMARRLLDRLALQSSLDGLDECFPFSVLSLEAPVADFYERYAVGP